MAFKSIIKFKDDNKSKLSDKFSIPWENQLSSLLQTHLSFPEVFTQLQIRKFHPPPTVVSFPKSVQGLNLRHNNFEIHHEFVLG